MTKTKLLLSAALLLSSTSLVTAETLRWARAGDALTLDPHAQNEGPTSALAHQIMEPLVMRDMTGAIVPALATEWGPSETKLFILLLLFHVVLPRGNAQTNPYLQEDLPAKIDNKQQWRDITSRTELKEFKDLLQELEAEEGKKKEEQKDSLDYQLGEPHPAIVMLIKFLLIAAGIGIIAFLLYKLLGEVNAPRDKKIKKGRLSEISLEEIEENIAEADLPDFIEQAVAEENYSLAIRLYYLLIIKELSANNLIQYQKDKTNRSYLRELAGTNFQQNFQQATRIFERVWYGQDELNKADFQQIEPTFQQFIKTIQNQPTAA